MTAEKGRDPALQMLLDRLEIHDLIVRYGRAVDRLDSELLRSVFHDDAAAEYGVFDGPAREFVEQVIPGLRAGFTATLHTVANEIAEIDGDFATGEAHVIASCVIERDGTRSLALLGGRYADRYERRDGAWKIASRAWILDWTSVMPVQATWEREQLVTGGRRDRGDRSYAHPDRAPGQ